MTHNPLARFRMLGTLLLVAMLAVCIGCSQDGAQRTASLRLVVDCPDFQQSRAINPSDAQMQVARYRISGTGPAGESFSAMTSDTGIFELEGLLQGRWTITAEALNTENLVLASGRNTVFLSSATHEASIVLDTLPGTGTLKATFSWNVQQVTDDVQLQLVLVDQHGAQVTLPAATIDRTQGTATLSKELPAGSYTLHARLMTQDVAVSGAVESVRIIDATTSAGTVELVIGDRGNGFVVTVVNDTSKPLQGTITCSPKNPTAHGSVILTFVPQGLPEGIKEADLQAQWYCEGALLEGETQLSYQCTPRPGTHRYDIVISHSKLGSVGSTKIMVEMPFS